MPRISPQPQDRVWFTGALAVMAPLATLPLDRPILTLAAGAASAGLLGWWLRRQLVVIAALATRMRAVSQETDRQDKLIETQSKLFQNVDMLRRELTSLGAPRRVGDRLFFGDVLINDDFAAVDHVKAALGGVATIFLGDLRVSTNVCKPDGSRAVGTRLAAGTAHDSVFTHARTYLGEVDILGAPYLSVYEPIVSAGEVIGIIFAGVRKDECAVAASGRGAVDAPREMGRALTRFEAASLAKGKAELEAAEQRYLAKSTQAESEALQRLTAATQRTVVDALSTALERLARRDLAEDVEAEFPADYAKLKHDFNTALNILRETLAQIGHASRAMRGNSGEIAAAADDLSRRTEQQAAALAETAAALGEITLTVKKTAQGVGHARDVVATARADAEHSGAIVQRAVAAMSAIEGSSQKISTIIGVIDEIAFQTSLLALNAGVEAARAGEAGRGFAVVASEVRALAQRSAEAAKEIKALILASGQQVGAGVNLVGEAGASLQRILAQVAEIDRIVGEIAATSTQQSSGLEEVNMAVGQMDQVTQQNAAMVEQSTAASHNLTAEAAALQQLIDGFSIGAGHADAVPPLASRDPGKARAVLKLVARGGTASKPQPARTAEQWQDF